MTGIVGAALAILVFVGAPLAFAPSAGTSTQMPLVVPTSRQEITQDPISESAEAVDVPALSAEPPSVESIIRSAAAIHGANPDQLVRVARCESGLNPAAIGDHGAAAGVFQFHAATFMANVRYSGFPYDLGDRLDAAASANVAAFMFARGQAGQWSCK